MFLHPMPAHGKAELWTEMVAQTVANGFELRRGL